MYGKIFDSMYEGTLYGQWEAIVTLQQLIVLADADGTIDMTPQAVSARTSIPFEIIIKGLKVLAEPDPYSRTPGEEGRRIALIDAHRPWGWYLVNHAKYKNLQDADTVRAQTRERVKKHREEKRTVTDGNGKKRHTDTDTDTDTKTITPPLPPSGAFLRFWTAWPPSARKHSRGKCWTLWRQKDFDQIAQAVLEHVESLKASDDWQRGYAPAPFTYLNQRRWEGAEAPEAQGLKVAMP